MATRSGRRYSDEKDRKKSNRMSIGDAYGVREETRNGTSIDDAIAMGAVTPQEKKIAMIKSQLKQINQSRKDIPLTSLGSAKSVGVMNPFDNVSKNTMGEVNSSYANDYSRPLTGEESQYASRNNWDESERVGESREVSQESDTKDGESYR